MSRPEITARVSQGNQNDTDPPWELVRFCVRRGGEYQGYVEYGPDPDGSTVWLGGVFYPYSRERGRHVLSLGYTVDRLTIAGFARAGTAQVAARIAGAMEQHGTGHGAWAYDEPEEA